MIAPELKLNASRRHQNNPKQLSKVITSNKTSGTKVVKSPLSSKRSHSKETYNIEASHFNKNQNLGSFFTVNAPRTGPVSRHLSSLNILNPSGKNSVNDLDNPHLLR